MRGCLPREGTAIHGTATLTLRLREGQEGSLDPGRLRVVRKDSKTGAGADTGVEPDEIQVVDFGRGKGVSFPISSFGSYVGAVQRPR